ncbi:SH3 domain-containing protein [Marivita geojedonensis]|uniref:SH3 domain-containing protein n=1 Tax=Marivita geojedonensis TaxID=1123756 RepID=UPI000A1FB024|nr:SH3 domain-containing protein [Marivita geojedonensis]PRY69874.1 SH3 domain-containing protein [Marivita geojedonensis]
MKIQSTALACALALAGGSLHAAEVSQDAIDACIDQVRAMAPAAGGGSVLSTEFSEANSLVMLEDGRGTTWRCLVSNDGRNPYVEMAGGGQSQPQADYADGMQGGPDYWRVNVHSTLNVHTSPSASSPTVARLHRGMIVENRGCQYSEGRRWCQIADGDATGWVAGEYLVESGSALAQDTSSTAEPTTRTERVQFMAGTSGQQKTGNLSPGSSIRFLLGAASRQTLEVHFVNSDPAITYQIFLPNGRVLLDQVPNTLPFQGELFMNGDHVVEVINRGHSSAHYAVYMGIY